MYVVHACINDVLNAVPPRNNVGVKRFPGTGWLTCKSGAVLKYPWGRNVRFHNGHVLGPSISNVVRTSALCRPCAAAKKRSGVGVVAAQTSKP
jgi:hypothetical protein